MRKYRGLFLLMICILLAVTGCQGKKTTNKEHDLVHVKSINGENQKKVVLVLIDSLMAQAIDKGIAQNELPAFKFLIEHGQYYKDVVSSFPTMSLTIDSSLFTGSYPNGHHVPGLIWYSTKEKKLINYGTGPMEIVKNGVSTVLVDGLIDLNGSHLNPGLPTIYEDLAKRGMRSGSINGLIYRGPVDHSLTIPPLILGLLPKKVTVKGPEFFAFGSLSDPLKGIQERPDSLTERLGLNNRYSVETANYLIKENKLPDFLYIYLADLDQKFINTAHRNLRELRKWIISFNHYCIALAIQKKL